MTFSISNENSWVFFLFIFFLYIFKGNSLLIVVCLLELFLYVLVNNFPLVSTHRQHSLGPKIKFCLFAIAYLPTIFPPTQKILLCFLEFFFFFFFLSSLCSAAKGDLVI